MLIDAIYDNGRLLFPKQYSFAHQRFSVKVELPDAELIEKNIIITNQESVAINSGIDELTEAGPLTAPGKYPVEFLEFKKLQDAAFGKAYVYTQEATDQELMQQHWMEKHA